ncbi:proline-rich protein PRCC isoform X2 [Bicyclus anynana]|uniref:Proline-rich protein PRCC isoform X2 n=1 Tax=Bicyclus anynana TaxID=110368 RepID=A0A6J1NY73_BICAN|nr:proline-rich protein PRCC isoform X2 [Bicyclus anynana]
MALVAYDNSDSSEYEEEENTITQIKKEDIDETDQVAQNVLSIFSQLPQPSNMKKDILEEDDDILHKKEHSNDVKPKSRITIPSLNDFKDVEQTVPSTKTRLPNGKKSGLLSILPEPRNAVRSTTKSLIPNVVAQKPQTSTAKRKPLPSPAKITNKSSLITDYSDDSDNEDVQNDFFSFNKKEELPIADLPLEDDKESLVTLKKEPRSIESYFKKEIEHVEVPTETNVAAANSDDYYSLNVEQYAEAGNSNEVVLDDEAILKLCGTRAKRKREEIQIVDVNQQEVLGDSKEWLLKGLMDDTTKRQSASKKHGNEPTSQQKRKHQITYLAHQAKANEAELQNQWANNRMSKRKTQSKYGF